MYHPMLIDFGKAIRLSDAHSKRKSMTAQEQESKSTEKDIDI